jgi:DNA-binding XRE family transcriptional regulator
MRTAAAKEARIIRANSLHRIRIARHLTQAQVANRVGITANQVSRYEHGRDDPGLDVFDRLLVALGCSYEDLRVSPENGKPQLISIKPAKLGFYGRLVDSDVVDVDAQVKAACGLPSDAPPHLAWQTWFAGVHADDCPRVKAELTRLKDRRDGIFNTRYRLIGRDGVERQIVDYGRMIFDDGGRPVRLQGLLFDITSEPRTENTDHKIANILVTVHQHLGKSA